MEATYQYKTGPAHTAHSLRWWADFYATCLNKSVCLLAEPSRCQTGNEWYAVARLIASYLCLLLQCLEESCSSYTMHTIYNSQRWIGRYRTSQPPGYRQCKCRNRQEKGQDWKEIWQRAVRSGHFVRTQDMAQGCRQYMQHHRFIERMNGWLI